MDRSHHTGVGIDDQDRETVGDCHRHRGCRAVGDQGVGVRSQIDLCFEKGGPIVRLGRQGEHRGAVHLLESGDGLGNDVLEAAAAGGETVANARKARQDL